MSQAAIAPGRQQSPEPNEGRVANPIDQAEGQHTEPAGAVEDLRLLWRNRRTLLRAGVLGALASLMVVLLIPVRFEATVELMPPDGQSGMGMAMLASMANRGATGSTASPLGSIAGDLLGLKNSGALFAGILASRSVADRVIEKFGLQKVYGTPKIEDARKALADHTQIVEDRKSGILSITVTDHDARRAAAMAQAYAMELDRLVAQVSTSSARRERIFLEERLRDVKRDLDAAAQDFSQFASNNTAINIPEQGRAMLQAAAILSGQLIAAESELRGLEAIYTDQNVRVQALRARVTELRSQLGKMNGGSVTTPASDESATPYPSFRRLPILGVTYADLFRRTKIEETVFELLTQQYELAKVQEAKEIPSVKILDPAVVPTKKSYPPRTVFTGLGTVMVLAFTIGWIFAKESWIRKDKDDPGKLLAQEVIDAVQTRARDMSPANGALAHAFRRIFNGQQPKAVASRIETDGLLAPGNGNEIS